MKKISVLNTLISLLLTTLLLSSCSLFEKKSSPPTAINIPQKSADEVSIMSFNVENLFDTEHDLGKEDFTYLPLEKKNSAEQKKYCEAQAKFRQKECFEFNWTSDLLDKKLKGLAKIILSVDSNGPDNLILIEVENEKILQILNSKYLGGVYQTAVLIEGWDERGIDVGFLSKFPLAGQPHLNKISFKSVSGLDAERAAKTRGILQIPILLPNKEKLTLMGAHFPSQGNPRPAREQAVQFLVNLMATESKNGAVIAGGDLNITKTEEEETQFFSGQFSQVGFVSHLVGCKTCLGSHYYKKSWSFLDALIFSKNLDFKDGTSGYYLDPESIQLVKHPTHLNKYNEPFRFNEETGEGISDHFPLYARLKKR